MSEATTGGAPSAPTSTPAAPAAANDNGSAPEGASAAANDNAAPPEPRHRVKVGGEERELTIAELAKLAEKGHGAEAKFREAAQLRKQMEAIVERLPTDTIGALEQLIGDKSKAARQVMAQLLRDPQARAEVEAYLVETYEYEAKPDAERRKIDEERDLREKARRAEEYEEAERERAHAAAVEQTQQTFVKQFGDALTSVGLTSSPHTLARMAHHVERAIDAKERVTLAELAQRVRDEHRADVTAHVSALDVEALADLLGEEKLAALRKRDVERLRPRAPQPERMPGNGKRRAEGSEQRPRQKMSSAEIFRRIRGE